MAQKRYQAKIIKRENFTISNSTGEIVTPTSQEKLLDGFNGDDRKFSLITLYSYICTIDCRTLRELDNYAWEVAKLHNLGCDFEVYIIPPYKNRFQNVDKNNAMYDIAGKASINSPNNKK